MSSSADVCSDSLIQRGDILLIFVPAIIGYICNSFCKVGEDAGQNVFFRPPAWVFKFVWPVLFLLFGLSWFVASKNCTRTALCMLTYLATVISLGGWILVYGCMSKKYACWILLVSICLCLACFTQGTEVSKLLLTPLLAWLLFAQLMNAAEVQHDYSVH